VPDTVPNTVPDTPDISALIRFLKDRHPAQGVRLIETHISWVLIAPRTAYKIKKPVKFAFVDFRTPAQRKHFCEEEVRLNQRLAPDIYQGVVPILYSPATGLWSIDPASSVDHAKVVDWAVKMRAFHADATLDQSAQIQPAQIDAIADVIASFHHNENPFDSTTALGAATDIARITNENLNELMAMLPNDPRLSRLYECTTQRLKELTPFFEQRKASGAVKQCHGDLHLGNIAWENDKPIIFDCIEFSDTLRCIDVINEIAFLFMDLQAKGRPDLAWRFLNRWLEHTGDYEGLNGLMFYAAYRALVRAKISTHQGKSSDAEKYLALAEHFAASQSARLTLMHGFSGSGKTFESQRLLETEGAIRIRSDVERKRLHSLESTTSSNPQTPSDLYQQAATQNTFDRLQALAQTLLGAGFQVIVDATFLNRALREQFIALGQCLRVPVQIVDMAVSPEICRQRILHRLATGGDASDATIEVLECQLQTADPLTEAELRLTIRRKNNHSLVKVSGTVPNTI
jgi:uncharacterized protein